MRIRKISGSFSVCRLEDYSRVKPDAPFCFIGKTDEENSLVCLTEDVPANTLAREDGWIAMRIEGVLDFSLVGILAKLASLLAQEGIPIFALSTFNTDYILVKREFEGRAQNALAEAGYTV